MTELGLYKFINEHNIEWHYENNDKTTDVIIFVHTYQLEYFQKILTPGIFDDSGIECRMMSGYFCFWMKDICEYYGIDFTAVFKKDKE